QSRMRRLVSPRRARLPCPSIRSCRSATSVFAYPFSPKYPISKSCSIPIPQRTEPLSMRCFWAAASRLGTKSSPSESFTTTLFPSCFVSMDSPCEERLGPDLQSSLDGLREVFRAAEGRVHLSRATRLDERHDVLEVAVVAERELRVEAVSMGVVDDRAPSAHVRA